MHTPLADRPLVEPTSILVIGPPLSGKTRSLITLMRWLKTKGITNPVWYMDLSGASASFLRLAQAEHFDNIDVITYKGKVGDKIAGGVTPGHDSGPILEFIEDVNKLYDMLDSAGAVKPQFEKQFPSCLIIDDTTNLSEHVMEFAVAMSGTAGGALGESIAHYGLYASKMTEIRKSIKALPLIFVMLCHDNLIVDELGGGTTIVPYLKGKVLPPVWAKDFSVVLYAKVATKDGKSWYCWQTRPDKKLRSAGTRFREDLPLEVDQDFAQVL